MDIGEGDIVEVTGAHHTRKGDEGIVDLIGGGTAWVIPTDTNTFEAIGEAFPILLGSLTRQPNRLEILRGMIQARANEHANLPDGTPHRAGSPRQYTTRPARKQPPL